MNQSKNSTPKISIPKTADGCSVAVTSSFSMTSVMNMLDTGHYPKGGVLSSRNYNVRQNYKVSKPPNQRQNRAADQSLFHQGNLSYSQFSHGSRRWLHPTILNRKGDMRKAILYKERTAEGRMLRKAYDTHKCSFNAKMKHRIPRTDGLSNTITSFFTDNLVLIVNEI